MTIRIAVIALLLIAWLAIVIWRNRGPWQPKTEEEFRKANRDDGVDYILIQPALSGDDSHHPGDGHDHGGQHFGGDGHDHGHDHGSLDHADSSDASHD